MTCPHCGHLVGDPIVRQLLICPECASTLVIKDGGCQLATEADTTVLREGELAQLRKARPAWWRAEQAARER